MKHEDWYVPGYGTEKVGPFLESLVELARPQRILEIGMGYTTPFLLEGLKSNTEGLLWDSNCDKEYLTKSYDPKFVVVDDLSFDSEQSKKRLDMLKLESLVHFIEGDFTSYQIEQDVEDLGPYDLVWFDCGGPPEYEQFMKEYWDLCTEYVFFHFTYFKGQPNQNMDAILNNATGSAYRMDIVEPNKFRQGSITMLRKVNDI